MAGPSYSAISTDDRDDSVVVNVPVVAGGSEDTCPTNHRRRRSSLGKFSFKGEASWTSSVVNLLNTIVGAGVLAMPAAMSSFGMLPGIAVIAFSAFCSGFGLYLQSRCAKYIERGTASFFSLSQITYPNAAVIFDAAIAIKCFGVGVSYLIIIGDLMPQVVEGFIGDVGPMLFLVDRKFWITAFMLVVIPLSFLRRLDSLKYTSFVALVSIGYLVILVVAHYIIGDTVWNRGEVRYFSWSGPIPALRAFPIIVFAYTCHQNMFSILNELEDNSHASTTSVVSGSIGTACAIYILVAITGYLSFGSNVTGNVIMMYATSFATTIGRAAIVILVMFSYPLQCHPCRASIDNVLKWRPSRASFRFPPPKITTAPVMSDLRFAAITSGVIVASYFVAMTVTSLERVLGFVGSTGSTSISFILPGVFYYKISDPNSAHPVLKEGEGEDCPWDFATGKKELLRKASMALVCYGVTVMAVCLYVNTFYAE